MLFRSRSKAQIQGSSTKMFPLALNSSDFVRKAKVRISTLRGPHAEAPPMKTEADEDPPLGPPPIPQDQASTSGSPGLVAAPGTVASGPASLLVPRREMPAASLGRSGAVPPQLSYPGAGGSQSLQGGQGHESLEGEAALEKTKEEEQDRKSVV